ncbi:hypothetical protein ES703_107936 [subsurface metagenome]
MEEFEDQQQQALWNFDGAELFLIFQIKSQIVTALEEWDLGEAYRKIRLLRGELDAKLIRSHKKIIEEFEKKSKKGEGKRKTEKAILDDKMKNLDNDYSIFIKINNPTNEKNADFYKKLEVLYMHLCYLMKKHGLYFREGEDPRFAVLRR